MNTVLFGGKFCVTFDLLCGFICDRWIGTDEYIIEVVVSM